MTAVGPHQPLHPAGWKAAVGYANGMAAEGRQVYLGGQIGWTGDQVFATDDFVGQARQALENVVAVLAEAGGRPEHLVRLTWFVVDKAEYLAGVRGLGAAYRAVMGAHYPAMSLVQVVALLEDRARVEIEATAVIPHDG